MKEYLKQNSGTVIMDVGKAFHYDEFESLFNESNYHILYIGEVYFIEDLKQNVYSQNVDYWSYEDLYSYDGYVFSDDEKTILCKVIDYIDNNKLTSELFDRTMSNYLFNYSTRNDVTLIKMIVSAYRFVLCYKPAFMLLYECSHNIRSWIVALVCEYLNIPVRYCRNHIFAWRNVLLEGMERHPILLGDESVNDGFSSWEYDLFKDTEERYSKGVESIKPEYLEVMKERRMKKLYSPWRDLKDDWKRLDRVIYKYKCYKAYESYCTTILPEKYIVFYLHLQPERTTLPEGYGFTQQYKAIELLNEFIPDDWGIVVKEHPATFYRYCTPMGRWPEFYKDLASLSKVVLVPLETDTYALMSGSKAIATIAGTVNREGLMMGKPVIMFGLDFFFGKKPTGIYFYEDEASLMRFIGSIDDLTPDDIKQSFSDYIKAEMMTTGTLGIKQGDKWVNSGQTIYESNRVSRYKLLKYILTK